MNRNYTNNEQYGLDVSNVRWVIVEWIVIHCCIMHNYSVFSPFFVFSFFLLIRNSKYKCVDGTDANCRTSYTFHDICYLKQEFTKTENSPDKLKERKNYYLFNAHMPHRMDFLLFVHCFYFLFLGTQTIQNGARAGSKK